MIDDQWGYRQKLQVALDKNISENVIMLYVFCFLDGVLIGEMKDGVMKHINHSHDYVQKYLQDSIESASNFKTEFDHSSDKWEKSDLSEKILEMRCEVAVLESLYGDKIKYQVQQLDDLLEPVSNLFGFFHDPKQIKQWKSSMKKLGVKAWWLELQSA